MKTPTARLTYTLTRSKDKHGNSLINQYTLLRSIGEGSFGHVKLAKFCGCYYVNSTQAVKVFKKEALQRRRDFFNSPSGSMAVKTALEDVYKEIEIIHRLNHPHIIKVHEIIDSEESPKIYLILDYCEKGQLLDWDPNTHRFKCSWQSDPLDENLIKSIVHQIAFGLNYLHSNKILHGDLKPQNILITGEMIVKLADFGQAIFLQNDDLISRTHGTYHFMSPECVAGNLNTAQGPISGKAAEVWALGVTVYAFIFKILPFEAENLHQLMQSIENKKVVYPATPRISQQLREVLERLLDKNPNSRITIQQLLQDPWLYD